MKPGLPRGLAYGMPIAALMWAAIIALALQSCTVQRPEVKSLEDAQASLYASITATAKTATSLWETSQESGVELITAEQLRETHDILTKAKTAVDFGDLVEAKELLNDRRRLMIFLLKQLPDE